MAINLLQIGAVEALPRRIRIEAGESTVGELFDIVSRQTGVDLRDALMREDVVILAGGRGIAAQDGLDTIVRDGDEVSIIPLCLGG